MKSAAQRILFYDGSGFRFEDVDAKHELRWAGWNRMGREGLLVGNQGTILIYTDGVLEPLSSPTKENLRCCEFSPKDDSALIVGNGGTMLTMEKNELGIVENDLKENLRRIAWRPNGEYCLIVGNSGRALRFTEQRIEQIGGAENNLRSIGWHPNGRYAIVTGDSYRPSMGGLVPSPTMYRYEEGEASLSPLQPLPDGRSDVISVAWKPDASSSVMVGFDHIWNTATVYSYNGETVSQIPWSADRTFPTAFAWNPRFDYAIMGTGGLALGEGEGAVFRYEGHVFSKILEPRDFRISCITWNPMGTLAIIIGSPRTRAFTV